MLCGCHYKIFANLEWAFEMRKGVINLNDRCDLLKSILNGLGKVR